MDVGGGGVFFEVFAALGSGDGDEVVAFGENPGLERSLAGLDSFPGGYGPDPINEVLVFIEVFWRRSGGIAGCGASSGLRSEGLVMAPVRKPRPSGE